MLLLILCEDNKSYGGSPPSYNGRLRPCRALGGLSVVLALGLCGWSDLRLSLRELASMGRAQNFRAHKNKFPYARKNIFLRTEISPRAHADFSLPARRIFSVRTGGNFRIYGNLFSYMQK